MYLLYATSEAGGRVMAVLSFEMRRAPCAIAVAAALFALGAGAQTPPDSERQPGTQPPAAQPPYPSAERPRGTTPAQREQRSDAAGADTPICNQEDELARSECLRRDMTDDEGIPAGVTRSMHQRKQQARQRADSTNVASEAETGSDQARGRSRTRTASRDLPGPENTEAQPSSEERETEPPETEANNASDTLGRER